MSIGYWSRISSASSVVADGEHVKPRIAGDVPAEIPRAAFIVHHKQREG